MADTATDGSKAEMALTVAGSADKVNAALGPLGNAPEKYKWWANLSATALICVLFVYLIRDNAAQSREDRLMFREELKAGRESHEKTADMLGGKLDRVRESVEVNTRAVERVKFGTGKGTINGEAIHFPEPAPPPVATKGRDGN